MTLDPESAREYFEQVKRKDDEDGACIDCGKIYPQWASVSFGIYICLECSGMHRSLGVHISFVRSLTMDSWSPDQLSKMRNGGNRRFKEWLIRYQVPLDLSINDKYRIPIVQKYKEKISALVADTPFTDPLIGEISNAPPVAIVSPSIASQNNIRAIGSSPSPAIPPQRQELQLPSLDIQLPKVDTEEIMSSISSAWLRFSTAAAETISQIAPPSDSQRLTPPHPQVNLLDMPEDTYLPAENAPPVAQPNLIDQIEASVTSSISSLWQSFSAPAQPEPTPPQPDYFASSAPPALAPSTDSSWSQLSSFWEKTKESFNETMSALSLDPTNAQPPSQPQTQIDHDDLMGPSSSALSTGASSGLLPAFGALWDKTRESFTDILTPVASGHSNPSLHPVSVTPIESQNSNWLNDITASPERSKSSNHNNASNWSDEEPVGVNPALLEETDSGPKESHECFDW